MPDKPKSVTIRTYAVGFGDCFLLSFQYAKRERHVLIDFGSTAAPAHAPNGQILRVANDIKDRCGGKLDAIVATHRHADHISGFATNATGTAAGDIIRSLKPGLVVQPWTEDPKARTDAKRPSNGKGHTNGRGRSALQFRRALDGMHAVAAAALDAGTRLAPALDREVAEQLSFMGEDNLKNVSAVRNLMSMRGAKRTYVYFGAKSGLEKLLPGVKVHVLGPPTLEQHAEIESQRARDDEEFWQFWRRQGLASQTSRVAMEHEQKLFARDVATHVPPELRWFQQRMTEVYGDSMLQLVRILDDAMNNTSVILLFEIGKKRLLFPGDAQIENWEYALSKPAVKKLLAGTTLYKVGHHGSLNATPKTALWPLFKKKGSRNRTKDRLVTLLSTREGKHGDVECRTEVPRKTLVSELQKQTQLVSTLKYRQQELYRDLVVPFTNGR